MLSNKNRESIETMAAYLRSSAVGLLNVHESHLTLAITHASAEDIKNQLSGQKQQFHLEVQQALRLSLEAWTSMMSMKEDDCQDLELLRNCLVITRVLPARLGLADDGTPPSTTHEARMWGGQLVVHAANKTFNPGPSKLARVCRFFTRLVNSDRLSMSELTDNDFGDFDLPRGEEESSLIPRK